MEILTREDAFKFVCRDCDWYFTRISNMEQPDTITCSHCGGMMDLSRINGREFQSKKWWQFWK